MQISDEIKAKLDLVEVVREYVPNLKPVGVNFTALSPFKREKTPSFVVSPDKQIWHCFSTGKGGDAITFVMEMEGVTFVEALRILAPKAGVVLKRENPEITSKRNRLLDIMETAALYYHKVLIESPLAKNAREYLAKRGLKEETIIDWKIGFSLDSWDDLINVLKKRGYNDLEIFAAGLSAKKEGRNSFYNRFRGRIMFPICDFNGDVVAFTARVSPEKEAIELMGKYINSPQTALYDKSKVVFGLDKAKMFIKNEGSAIVVEGQMDCITCHQAGFKNVVASSGTAFTLDQLKLIKRYSNNVLFSFDMDEAGQLAADRGIREALSSEMNIKVITIPEGKDPDELINNNPGAWKEAVAGAKHIMQYYFDKIFASYNIQESEGKREAARIILPIIGRLPDRIEQDHWLQKLAGKLQVGENALRETLQKYLERDKKVNSYQPKERVENVAPVKRQNKEESLSESLLALVLKFPLFFNYVSDRLSIDHIFGQENKLFYRNLIMYYNDSINNSASTSLSTGVSNSFGIGASAETSSKLNYQDLKNFLASQEGAPEESALPNLLDKLEILGDKDFFSLEPDKAKNEIIKMTMALKTACNTLRCREIQKEISEQEKSGHGQEVQGLMEELKDLQDEMKKNNDEIE